MDPQSYVGRREHQSDIADPQRVAGLAALLDHGGTTWLPGLLPPLGHWLLFHPQARQSDLGKDGHPQRGASSLLPAVQLPRRMWAGSRIEFKADIALGATLHRTSTVVAVNPKTGRSGAMLFVTVCHEISGDDGKVVIIENQDIVYREIASSAQRPQYSDAEPQGMMGIVKMIVPDELMLFRYSALTFNAHRIHYDQDFCREVEGYPALVVHGPFTATLLLDHALRERPRARIDAFSFRGLKPAFSRQKLALDQLATGNDVALNAYGPDGPAMSASVRFAS